jgi:hypothetical protein
MAAKRSRTPGRGVYLQGVDSVVKWWQAKIAPGVNTASLNIIPRETVSSM